MALQPTATAANPSVIPDTPLLALYDEARILCGLSQKEMAITAGVNEGTFSQALRGEGSRTFNPEWIDRQSHDYKVALTTLMQRKFGVTREAARAVIVRKLFAAIEELLTLTTVDL
jgi:transcriptional regulator with XRE-family HTH domain